MLYLYITTHIPGILPVISPIASLKFVIRPWVSKRGKKLG